MTKTDAAIKFEEIFKVKLSDYWYQMPNIDLGFDVIKFDEEFLKTPDGVSTAQYLDKLYGVEVRKFVQSLIGLK